ncbi:MAG: hypothetical protein Q8R39_03620 [bacterium]|nr:hypothetical protein [bacterium]MDZ4284255.1 hypothetical protein [Patescibacteria group bacterium]
MAKIQNRVMRSVVGAFSHGVGKYSEEKECGEAIHWTRSGGSIGRERRRAYYRLLENYAQDYCLWAREHVVVLLRKKFVFYQMPGGVTESSGCFASEAVQDFCVFAWNALAGLRLLCNPRRLLSIDKSVGARMLEQALAGLKTLFELCRPLLTGEALRRVFRKFRLWWHEWCVHVRGLRELIRIYWPPSSSGS